MKRLLVIALAVSFVLASASAYAETKVSLGIKGWYNSWFETYSDGSDDTDLGSSLMLGPSLNVKFENGLGLGVSLLKSLSDYETEDLYYIGDTMTADRTDIDLTLSYMFTPRFGIFVGYKDISADLNWEYMSSTDTAAITMSGPGIGIMGNIPIGETVALYGSAAYMSIDYEFEDWGGTTWTDELTGGSLELGIAFAMSESFSANLGYKYQKFSGDDYAEEFNGPTFGLTYTF